MGNEKHKFVLYGFTKSRLMYKITFNKSSYKGAVARKNLSSDLKSSETVQVFNNRITLYSLFLSHPEALP